MSLLLHNWREVSDSWHTAVVTAEDEALHALLGICLYSCPWWGLTFSQLTSETGTRPLNHTSSRICKSRENTLYLCTSHCCTCTHSTTGHVVGRSSQYQIRMLQVYHVEVSILVGALVLEAYLGAKVYFGPRALDRQLDGQRFSNSKRFTHSCSASVNDIKSASDPD